MWGKFYGCHYLWQHLKNGRVCRMKFSKLILIMMALTYGSIYGRNDSFSVQNAYLKLLGSCPASPWFAWMWKSCKSRLKFFFWPVSRDKINTRNLLSRKIRHLDSCDCVLCRDQKEETLVHLLFECTFSHRCWRFLGLQWNLQLQPDAILNQARRVFNSRIFREVLIVGCWTIWCHRNGVIFL